MKMNPNAIFGMVEKAPGEKLPTSTKILRKQMQPVEAEL